MELYAITARRASGSLYQRAKGRNRMRLLPITARTFSNRMPRRFGETTAALIPAITRPGKSAWVVSMWRTRRLLPALSCVSEAGARGAAGISPGTGRNLIFLLLIILL